MMGSTNRPHLVVAADGPVTIDEARRLLPGVTRLHRRATILDLAPNALVLSAGQDELVHHEATTHSLRSPIADGALGRSPALIVTDRQASRAHLDEPSTITSPGLIVADRQTSHANLDAPSPITVSTNAYDTLKWTSKERIAQARHLARIARTTLEAIVAGAPIIPVEQARSVARTIARTSLENTIERSSTKDRVHYDRMTMIRTHGPFGRPMIITSFRGDPATLHSPGLHPLHDAGIHFVTLRMDGDDVHVGQLYERVDPTDSPLSILRDVAADTALADLLDTRGILPRQTPSRTPPTTNP